MLLLKLGLLFLFATVAVKVMNYVLVVLVIHRRSSEAWIGWK